MNWHTIGLGLITIGLVGCQGVRTNSPPIDLVPNLDNQPKYGAQQLPLTPPPNTIPQDEMDNTPITTGRIDGNNQFVSKIPIPVTEKLMNRGQDRFMIYCAACHDRAGTGMSATVKRGLVPPPKLGSESVVKRSDGELFSIITNGIRTMPGFHAAISVQDRWAIVAYVRAIGVNQSNSTASGVKK